MVVLSKELVKKFGGWRPTLRNIRRSVPIQTNSWFNITEHQWNVANQTESKIDSSGMKAKMCMVMPTLSQRGKLLTWFELYRLTYNYTVRYFKHNKVCSFTKIRPIITNQLYDNDSIYAKIKQSQFPKHTLDNAIKDVVKAYKTSFALLKKKQISHFRLRYKRQQSPRQTLVLESGAFSKIKNAFCTRALGVMQTSHPLNGISHDCRLVYNTRSGAISLHIPYEYQNQKELSRWNTCSLDPGMRTFQTVYSDNGAWYSIGDDNPDIKTLISRVEAVADHKDKQWYRKYTSRLREKIRNKIKDLHCKTAHFLCTNFNKVIIGKLSTKGIVENGRSVLRDASKRYVYALAHHTFRERLKAKCAELDCEYVEVNEAYTSKTCGKCGEVNHDLGASKTFNCVHCKYTTDRDVNGARNIMIKC